MKSQLIPEDIDRIIGLIEQIADGVLKSDFLTKDEQRQLNDHVEYEKASRSIETEKSLGMLGPTRWNLIKAYERQRDRIQTPYEPDKANLLKSKRNDLRDKHVKATVPPLQRKLDLYLAPRWAGLLQCSSWGFRGGELRKAIEYYFLGIPAGYTLFTSENILASRKSKVIRELERIRAKLEYDIQRLMSSKVESSPKAEVSRAPDTIAAGAGEQESPPESKEVPRDSQTPVSLKKFMQECCAKCSHNFIDSRVKALHGQKGIKLPKYEGKWTSGQSKKYRPCDLIEKWPSYREVIPNLPVLKDNPKPTS